MLQNGNPSFLGASLKNIKLSIDEELLVREHRGTQTNFEINEYSSIICDNGDYYEGHFHRKDHLKRTTDNFVVCEDGHCGEIIRILALNGQPFFIVNINSEIDEADEKLTDMGCTTIKILKEIPQVKIIISPETLKAKRVLIKYRNFAACTIFPNGISRN